MLQHALNFTQAMFAQIEDKKLGLAPLVHVLTFL